MVWSALADGEIQRQDKQDKRPMEHCPLTVFDAWGVVVYHYGTSAKIQVMNRS